MPISQELREQLLDYQRNEITEHHIYRRLAQTIRSPENRHVLERRLAYRSKTLILETQVWTF
jgi:macrodomain Ter protein organizer (MatP/YcbG family)